MRFPSNVVTISDTNSGDNPTPGKCAWCSKKLGDPHKPDCFRIERPVHILLKISLVMPVPRSCSPAEIEMVLNDGLCMSQILAEAFRMKGADDCFCRLAEVDYDGEATAEEAAEANLKFDTDEFESDEPKKHEKEAKVN